MRNSALTMILLALSLSGADVFAQTSETRLPVMLSGKYICSDLEDKARYRMSITGNEIKVDQITSSSGITLNVDTSDEDLKTVLANATDEIKGVRDTSLQFYKVYDIEKKSQKKSRPELIALMMVKDTGNALDIENLLPADLKDLKKYEFKANRHCTPVLD